MTLKTKDPSVYTLQNTRKQINKKKKQNEKRHSDLGMYVHTKSGKPRRQKTTKKKTKEHGN